jgi:hypothetical protein
MPGASPGSRLSLRGAPAAASTLGNSSARGSALGAGHCHLEVQVVRKGPVHQAIEPDVAEAFPPVFQGFRIDGL